MQRFSLRAWSFFVMINTEVLERFRYRCINPLVTKLFNEHKSPAYIKWMILINLLNPTGHVMHQQFNIQQLYVLPTLYLCVLYLSENKQQLVPLTA